MKPINTAGLIEKPGFQPPRFIDSFDDCYFYHGMDLPGYGFRWGEWDLRSDIGHYLGDEQFQGKRVVDVGAATGCPSFAMEQRGAEVTAFDIFFRDETNRMGLIPYFDFESRFGASIDRLAAERRYSSNKLQNSFWYSHRLLGSKVRLYSGTAYECPDELGEFDYVFFGSILLHLMNPLQALWSFAQRAKEKVIVTESYEDVGAAGESPVLFFRPSLVEKNPGTYWYLTPKLLEMSLQILGFRDFRLSFHEALHAESERMVRLFTLVATR